MFSTTSRSKQTKFENKIFTHTKKNISELETGVERTTLLDLPDLCSDKILRHLDLQQLAIVASVSNCLKSNAIHVFRMDLNHRDLDTKRFSETNNDLFKLILQEFGPYFASAKIQYDKSQQFVDALAEYSGASLSTLTVELSESGQRKLIINRPFANAQHLIFRNFNRYTFQFVNQRHASAIYSYLIYQNCLNYMSDAMDSTVRTSDRI